MLHSDCGHLEYYKKFAISPVRYDLSDLGAHFDRRSSLYRQLGLPEVAIRGCRVLEVAPGSGHNSLFLAQARPASLDLVEPNPAGIADIRATYSQYDAPCTEPTLHEKTLQDFEPDGLYDLVLCENWLGALPDERELIKKLASMASLGGALVMTIVPHSGFMPNVLRKLMADKIAAPDMDFDAKTELFVKAFGPHLATIASMTRSHVDWVRDCMINPHYLNVALPLDTVLADIGADMELLGSSPTFNTDWRWFKSLHGEARQFNESFRDSYVANSHNFVDYRQLYAPRTESENSKLETVCDDLHGAAVALEKNLMQGGDWNGADATRVLQLIEDAALELSTVSPHFSDALKEAGDALASDNLDAAAVANQKHFNALFGRETVYVSFTRRTNGVQG
jgi:2-polyprenyl-3-methyl-5-hydroxy-6-metoxy-1,4-benzoquinol methylase